MLYISENAAKRHNASCNSHYFSSYLQLPINPAAVLS